MFKKSKFLILLPILLLVTLVTGGFSYYLFNTSSNVTSLDNVGTGSTTNESRNDKIYENYSFSDTGSGNEYTFYFFPSTLYLELYNNGYDQPEEVFGYNELVFDDNGNPKTSAEGEPLYEVENGTSSIERTQYTLQYEERTNYWDPYHFVWGDRSISKCENTFEIPSNYYLNDDGYYYVNGQTDSTDAGWSRWTQKRFKKIATQTINYSTYYSYLTDWLNGETSYYYQDKQDITFDISNNSYTQQNGSGADEVLSPTINEKDVYDLELTHPYPDNIQTEDIYMGRRQYRNDRFGFWPTLYDQDDPHNESGLTDGYFNDKGSRYLPIKIAINGNLTADLYDLAIPTPLTSSYVYSSGWFNYYFAFWTYVTDTDIPYQTAIQGLYGNSQANIFDIMRNPSLYADENNVIRLYPYFTRGNGDAPGEGNGKDKVLVQYSYNEVFEENNRMDSLIKETPLNYSTETLQYTNNGGTLSYAILTDVYLEKDKYSKIVFKTHISDSNGDTNPTNVTSHNLTANVVNQIVDAFGEGKYTFYMFVKNAGGAYNQSYVAQNGSVDVEDNIGQILTGNMDGSSLFTGQNLYFNSLYKKNLFYFNIVDGNYEKHYATGVSDVIIHNGGDNNYRPLLLMFEKVSNFKVVENIPFPELEDKGNNSYSGDFLWEDVDDSISSIYDHSKNMMLADGVYEIDSNTFDEENFTLNGQTNLSIENPFIYVIQNCDFRYVDSLFFQIRVGNDYIRQAINIVTDFDDSKGPEYLAYQSGRDSNNNPIYSYFASQNALFPGNTPGNTSGNTSEFVIQNADVTDRGGNIRHGLKLKDNYARGVYDLMLVPTGSPTTGKPIDCNLYIYRHRVDFIKIMKEAPGTTSTINGQDVGAKFIDHYDDSKVLWESSFYIGDTFNASSASNGTPSTTVLKALRNYSETNGNKNFALKDSVTGDAIAYYRNGILYGPSGNSNDGNDVELFTILKNYVLYVE